MKNIFNDDIQIRKTDVTSVFTEGIFNSKQSGYATNRVFSNQILNGVNNGGFFITHQTGADIHRITLDSEYENAVNKYADFYSPNGNWGFGIEPDAFYRIRVQGGIYQQNDNIVQNNGNLTRLIGGVTVSVSTSVTGKNIFSNYNNHSFVMRDSTTEKLEFDNGLITLYNSSYSTTPKNAKINLSYSGQTSHTTPVKIFSSYLFNGVSGGGTGEVFISHVASETGAHNVLFDSTFSGNVADNADWVFSSGKVGIGTTSPDIKLSISDITSGFVNQAIFGQDKTSGTSAILIGEEDAVDKTAVLAYNHDNNYFSITIGGDSSDEGIVVKRDAIGIGTLTPNSKLEVSGTIDATAYKVAGVAGANFDGAVTNITVVDGIVTAVS